MSNKKPTIMIIVVVSFIIAITALYFLLTIDVTEKPLARQGSHVSEIISLGGEFTLKDQNNNIFTDQNLKHKLSLVYFGFTACPSICPESLSKMSAVVQTLHKYKIEIQPIFITLDPERDSVSVMQSYCSKNYPGIIGLTGNVDEIKSVAEKFKVYYMKSSNNDSADNANYMVDHSSFIYLMDNGQYVKHFHLEEPAESIIEFIRVNHSQLTYNEEQH